MVVEVVIVAIRVVLVVIILNFFHIYIIQEGLKQDTAHIFTCFPKKKDDLKGNLELRLCVCIYHE